MNILVTLALLPLNNKIIIMIKFITLLTVLSTVFIFSSNSAEAQTSSSKDYTYKSGQPNYTLKIFSHYNSSRQPVYKYYRQNVNRSYNSNYYKPSYRYRNSYRSSRSYGRSRYSRSSYGSSRSYRRGYSKGYSRRSYRY